MAVSLRPPHLLPQALLPAMRVGLGHPCSVPKGDAIVSGPVQDQDSEALKRNAIARGKEIPCPTHLQALTQVPKPWAESPGVPGRLKLPLELHCLLPFSFPDWIPSTSLCILGITDPGS